MVPSKTASVSPPPTRTFTPTKDPCDGIYVTPKKFSGDKMEWNVINTTAFDIYIDAIWIEYWPPSHEELNKVKLDGDTLWDGEDEDPPLWMPPWSTDDAKKRKVKTGDTRVLKFEFDTDAGSPDYDLVVRFSNGCSISP
jgi:hypothetical protein